MNERSAAIAAGGLMVAHDLVEGVLAVDARNTIVFANEGAHRILDRRPGTLVGGSAMEGFLDHRVEALIAVARRQGSATGDLPPRISDGRWLVARARRGHGDLVWVVLEDVSELRRLQRIRAEFVDNLSHELRTPVTNVNLLLEMLMRDAEALPPRTRERLERLQVEAAQLAQMVSELLDLASIEEGQPLLLGETDLADVAREQVERLHVFAERSGVTLSLEAPGPAPIVRGDPTRLGQAILNLVHNAVKFSEPGDAVVVRVGESAGLATVAVVDEGAGIPRADRDRIFERFYKVDRARRRGTGGTGLGLSIVRNVIEAHGGTVRVDSEDGVGSTFTIELPVVGRPGPATPGGVDVPGAGATGERPSRTLVLAHRGDARGLPENTIDALLAALAVPGCDGLEFDVRTARDGTPVLAHDATLARVFGRPERVADLSTAELAAIGVPTLREVLEVVPPRAFLDVELKADVGEAVVPVLRAARGPDLANAVVSSFDHEALATVRRLAPSWPTWLNAEALGDRAIADAVALGARVVSAEVAAIEAVSVAAARAAGLQVAAWTVVHPWRLTELAALGVVAVCVEVAALDAGGAAVASADEGEGEERP